MDPLTTPARILIVDDELVEFVSLGDRFAGRGWTGAAAGAVE